MLRFIFLIPALVLTVPRPQPVAAQHEELIVILRVDDILSRNMTVLPRSIRPFEEMAEERGAVVTWGVIPHRLIEPANEDGALASELRETVQRGHELSLHGYNHICARCGQTSHEMYCTRDGVAFTHQQQHEMLAAGLQIMEERTGTALLSFIPPGHAMDESTYEVQIELGMPILSVPGPHRRFDGDPVFNLQPHDEFTWALTEDAYRTELDRALADVSGRGERDGYYMFLFHDFFTRPGYENGVVLRWTAELLDSLVARYGPRLRFMTLTEAAGHFGGVNVSAAVEGLVAVDGVQVLSAFPNPSSGHFTWLIENDAPRRATVSLYDVSGRRISVPFDGTLHPGRTSLHWSIAELPPGAYLYRVEADGRRAAGTVIVAR